MSTILKALRRLQEEKSQQDGQQLREDVVLSPEPPPRLRSGGRMVLAIGTAAFVLVGGALLAWERIGPDEQVARDGEAAVRLAGASDSARSNPPPTAPSAVVPAATPARDEVDPSPPAPSARPVSPDSLPVLAASPSPTPSPVPTPEATPSPRPTPGPSAEPTASPVPTPEATPSPRPTPVPTESPRPRATAPPPRPALLSVERTQWHPDPAKRRAWVRVQGEDEPRAVAEGDRVGSYRVRTIEPAAVLFADGPVEIRRKVGAP